MAETLARKSRGKFIPKTKRKKTVAEEFPERLEKKREHVELLANSMRGLRNKLTRDMKSEDEKEALTALIVAIIDATAERIGNIDSETNGHFGVTGFRKKHVTIDGNTVTIKYKGKSGVDHEKKFSNEAIADALRTAIKNSPTKHLFVTSEGFRIIPERVNRYLDEYGITAKDIRGYSANKWIINKLEKKDIPAEEKDRKKLFNNVARCTAIKIGHGYATLKSHYMFPELETEYVENGKIIDLTEFYSGGGSTK